MIEFGDGESTGWRSGGIQATHDYPRSGEYTARLTVRGPGGTDSATQSVSATLPIL
jgi:PKD repeat protein